MKELIEIQKELKAPKNQRNNFGKYNYRSCEDILEAVKPLVNEKGCSVLLSDAVEQIGERIYVKAIATLYKNKEEFIQTTAYAREPLQQKGMNEAQITGSASSYARKYALNGLFAIDDTKDSDTNEYKKQSDNSPVGKIPLTESGLKFLEENGTLKQVDEALFNRSLTSEQKVILEELKKTFNTK